MRELPILTDEEEATLIRRHASIRRLGGSRLPVKRVHCPRCGTDYNAGSGHRGSLWCDHAQRIKLLRSRGLNSIAFTYIEWFRETQIPFEVHMTGTEFPVPSPTGQYAYAYKGVGALTPRLWVPKDVTSVCGHTKESKASRIRKLLALRDRQLDTWIAAGIGQHGLRRNDETGRWISR